MTPNPTFIPARRRRLGKARRLPPAAPAVPPVLVAASYVTATRIELTFDVPVNVTGLVLEAFILFDGPNSTEYRGDGLPTLVSPTVLHLDLLAFGPTGGGQVLLTVFDGNGVVAESGGAQLVGFAALPLPYP